ncbi:putative ribonuclease H-like domain-containing protein, partial [Tanacetum coccineum]
MNYKLVVAGNQSNGNAGTKACADAGKARVETVPSKDYILLPLWTQDSPFSSSPKDSPDAGFKPSGEEEKKNAKDPGKDSEIPKVNVVDLKTSIELLDDPNMPELEDIVYSDDDEDVGAEADMNNLDAFMPVSPIPTIRIHKDHPCSRGPTIKTFKIACLLAFYHKKNPRRTKQGWLLKGTQEEGIDYDEVFVPVAKIEAIRLKRKSMFVNHQDLKIQTSLTEYKVEKALYGLHQAPRAWYETLLTYLLDNGFQRGKIDKTLFIKRDKGDIFFMGELTFFLGLQVKQKEDGILLSQDKYVTEILKKFSFSDVKTASTPIETHKPLLKDVDGEDIDEH